MEERAPHLSSDWRFENTYINLPSRFYSQQLPTPVNNPQVVLFNVPLAQSLGLTSLIGNHHRIAKELSGNDIPVGSQPIAQAYAGHQFGHFTMLGDGRAVLLGEHIAPNGDRLDIQLKGAGQTPYSRRGDGRATFRSMLREYIISEAMYHLGIPTSRSLAVISTGEKVFRESVHNGAVLTRVMSSHIRVGTFEYARQFGSTEELNALLQYTLQRHYPVLLETPNPALELVRTILHKQIELVNQWLCVGFIHGVMNTDNMGIACETYDYGPCAFMNAYNPKTVFSSIDQQGRYAFEHQPFIVQWNVSVLAEVLLPLIHSEEEKAVELAQSVLEEFENYFIQQWYRMMLNKIGIEKLTEESKQLLTTLMDTMHKNEMDYTNTFRSLCEESLEFEGSSLKEIHPQWLDQWQRLIDQQANGIQGARMLMLQVNPAFVPRNHAVEFVLDIAESGNMAPLMDLLEFIKTPYAHQRTKPEWNRAPVNHDKGYVTFCGT